eukprot:ANDGO_04160.mRNA.1 hypothetical protein
MSIFGDVFINGSKTLRISSSGNMVSLDRSRLTMVSPGSSSVLSGSSLSVTNSFQTSIVSPGSIETPSMSSPLWYSASSMSLSAATNITVVIGAQTYAVLGVDNVFDFRKDVRLGTQLLNFAGTSTNIDISHTSMSLTSGSKTSRLRAADLTVDLIGASRLVSRSLDTTIASVVLGDRFVAIGSSAVASSYADDQIVLLAPSINLRHPSSGSTNVTVGGALTVLGPAVFTAGFNLQGGLLVGDMSLQPSFISITNSSLSSRLDANKIYFSDNVRTSRLDVSGLDTPSVVSTYLGSSTSLQIAAQSSIRLDVTSGNISLLENTVISNSTLRFGSTSASFILDIRASTSFRGSVSTVLPVSSSFSVSSDVESIFTVESSGNASRVVFSNGSRPLSVFVGSAGQFIPQGFRSGTSFAVDGYTQLSGALVSVLTDVEIGASNMIRIGQGLNVSQNLLSLSHSGSSVLLSSKSAVFASSAGSTVVNSSHVVATNVIAESVSLSSRIAILNNSESIDVSAREVSVSTVNSSSTLTASQLVFVSNGGSVSSLSSSALLVGSANITLLRAQQILGYDAGLELRPAAGSALRLFVDDSVTAVIGNLVSDLLRVSQNGSQSLFSFSSGSLLRLGDISSSLKSHRFANGSSMQVSGSVLIGSSLFISGDVELNSTSSLQLGDLSLRSGLLSASSNGRSSVVSSSMVNVSSGMSFSAIMDDSVWTPRVRASTKLVLLAPEVVVTDGVTDFISATSSRVQILQYVRVQHTSGLTVASDLIGTYKVDVTPYQLSLTMPGKVTTLTPTSVTTTSFIGSGVQSLVGGAVVDMNSNSMVLRTSTLSISPATDEIVVHAPGGLRIGVSSSFQTNTTIFGNLEVKSSLSIGQDLTLGQNARLAVGSVKLDTDTISSVVGSKNFSLSATGIRFVDAGNSSVLSSMSLTTGSVISSVLSSHDNLNIRSDAAVILQNGLMRVAASAVGLSLSAVPRSSSTSILNVEGNSTFYGSVSIDVAVGESMSLSSNGSVFVSMSASRTFIGNALVLGSASSSTAATILSVGGVSEFFDDVVFSKSVNFSSLSSRIVIGNQSLGSELSASGLQILGNGSLVVSSREIAITDGLQRTTVSASGLVSTGSIDAVSALLRSLIVSVENSSVRVQPSGLIVSDSMSSLEVSASALRLQSQTSESSITSSSITSLLLNSTSVVTSSIVGKNSSDLVLSPSQGKRLVLSLDVSSSQQMVIGTVAHPIIDIVSQNASSDPLVRLGGTTYVSLGRSQSIGNLSSVAGMAFVVDGLSMFAQNVSLSATLRASPGSALVADALSGSSIRVGDGAVFLSSTTNKFASLDSSLLNMSSPTSWSAMSASSITTQSVIVPSISSSASSLSIESTNVLIRSGFTTVMSFTTSTVDVFANIAMGSKKISFLSTDTSKSISVEADTGISVTSGISTSAITGFAVTTATLKTSSVQSVLASSVALSFSADSILLSTVGGTVPSTTASSLFVTTPGGVYIGTSSSKSNMTIEGSLRVTGSLDLAGSLSLSQLASFAIGQVRMASTSVSVVDGNSSSVVNSTHVVVGTIGSATTVSSQSLSTRDVYVERLLPLRASTNLTVAVSGSEWFSVGQQLMVPASGAVLIGASPLSPSEGESLSVVGALVSRRLSVLDSTSVSVNFGLLSDPVFSVSSNASGDVDFVRVGKGSRLSVLSLGSTSSLETLYSSSQFGIYSSRGVVVGNDSVVLGDLVLGGSNSAIKFASGVSSFVLSGSVLSLSDSGANSVILLDSSGLKFVSNNNVSFFNSSGLSSPSISTNRLVSRSESLSISASQLSLASTSRMSFNSVVSIAGSTVEVSSGSMLYIGNSSNFAASGESFVVDGRSRFSGNVSFVSSTVSLLSDSSFVLSSGSLATSVLAGSVYVSGPLGSTSVSGASCALVSADGLSQTTLSPSLLTSSEVRASRVFVSESLSSVASDLQLRPANSSFGVMVDVASPGQFFAVGNSSAVGFSVSTVLNGHVVQMGSTGSRIQFRVGNVSAAVFSPVSTTSASFVSEGSSVLGGSVSILGSAYIRGAGRSLFVGDTDESGIHVSVAGSSIQLLDGSVPAVSAQLLRDRLAFTNGNGFTSQLDARQLNVSTIVSSWLSGSPTASLNISTGSAQNMFLTSDSGFLSMVVGSIPRFGVSSSRVHVQHSLLVDGRGTFTSGISVPAEAGISVSDSSTYSLGIFPSNVTIRDSTAPSKRLELSVASGLSIQDSASSSIARVTADSVLVNRVFTNNITANSTNMFVMDVSASSGMTLSLGSSSRFSVSSGAFVPLAVDASVVTVNTTRGLYVGSASASVPGLSGAERLIVSGDVVVTGTFDARGGLKLVGLNNSLSVGDTTIVQERIVVETSGQGRSTITAGKMSLVNDTFSSVLTAGAGQVLRLGSSSNPVLTVTAGLNSRDVVAVSAAGSLVVGGPVDGTDLYNASVHVLAVDGPSWFGLGGLTIAGDISMLNVSNKLRFGTGSETLTVDRSGISVVAGSLSSVHSSSSLSFSSTSTSSHVDSVEVIFSSSTSQSSLSASNVSSPLLLADLVSSRSSILSINASNAVQIGASSSGSVSLFGDNLFVQSHQVSMNPSNGVLIGSSSSGRSSEVLVVDGNALFKSNVSFLAGIVSGNSSGFGSLSQSGLRVVDGGSSATLSASTLSVSTVVSSKLDLSSLASDMQFLVNTSQSVVFLSDFVRIFNGPSRRTFLLGGTPTLFSSTAHTFGVVGDSVFQGSITVADSTGSFFLSGGLMRSGSYNLSRTDILNASISSVTPTGSTTISGPSLMVSDVFPGSSVNISSSAIRVGRSDSANTASLTSDGLSVSNGSFTSVVTRDRIETSTLLGPSALTITTSGSSNIDISSGNRVTVASGSSKLTVASASGVQVEGAFVSKISSGQSVSFEVVSSTKKLTFNGDVLKLEKNPSTYSELEAGLLTTTAVSVSNIYPLSGSAPVLVTASASSTLDPNLGILYPVFASVGVFAFQGNGRVAGNVTVSAVGSTKSLLLSDSLITISNTASSTSATLSSSVFNFNSVFVLSPTMVTIGKDATSTYLSINGLVNETVGCFADVPNAKCLYVNINGVQRTLLYV